MAHQATQPRHENPTSLLLEFLDASPQPTFFLNLLHSQSLSEGKKTVLEYTNPALHQLGWLHARVVDQIEQTSLPPEILDSHIAADRNVHTYACRATITFCGIQWTVTIVGQWWAVVTLSDHHGIYDDRAQPNSSQTCRPRSVEAIHTRESERMSSSIEIATNQGGPTRIVLGAVSPQGQLGDIEHLEWVRQYNWDSSSYGPIDSWPPELRQACEMALASPDPSGIIWGSDHTIAYNHAFAIISGDKHPRAMGRPYIENWREHWPVYQPIFRRIKEYGESFKQKNVLRMLIRDGSLEETFFDSTFIPILTAKRSIEGIYVHVNETTRQVVSERRMQILININEAMATASSLKDLWTSLRGVLQDCKSDVHFAAVYSIDLRSHSNSNEYAQPILEATVGMNGLQFDPSSPGHTKSGLGGAVQEAFRTSKTKVLSTADNNLPESLLNQLESCSISGVCREVVIQPLRCNIEEQVVAAMVIGASPLRKFDADYRSFIRLLTKQIENAITVVRGIEKERALLQAQVVSEMEKRFWLFAEKAPVGMYMYDREGTMTFCNKAFEQLVGMSQPDLARPMAWLDTIHPDGIETIQSVWEDTIRLGGAHSFEVQFKKPWSSHTNDVNEALDRTWALGSSSVEMSDDGEVRTILGCVTDISSVKWAEQAQSMKLAEALEQKRQQENFLDITSHEMRNPLNAIFHSASELAEQIYQHLKDSAISSEDVETLTSWGELVTTITYCANHQKRIVDDVLTLSKLDARLLKVFPDDTDPVRLLERILGLFAPEIRASGVEPSLEVTEQYRKLAIKLALMDPYRITQIIVNLLSNAIKFMKRRSKRCLYLTLDASLEEPSQGPQGFHYVPSGSQYQDPTQQDEWGDGEIIYLSFSVQDTGLGMTQDESSHLFRRFSQASPRTHAQFGGSGLGLFISRELVEMQGGRIGLSSEAGSGSLFEFYIKARRSFRSPGISAESEIPLPALPIQQLHLSTPPLDSEDHTPIEENDSSQPSLTLSGPSQPTRILIVEDNIINQRLLNKLIKKRGYDTVLANNGEEALASISNSAWNTSYGANHKDAPRIDVVLCDIEMPVMDGKACVQRIRQLQDQNLLVPEIPVIAVTGNARGEQIERAKDCGFDAVVTKPYSIADLLDIVEQYVTKRHPKSLCRSPDG
ncbi:Nn.00g049040.m01.CDS01 [Neocucurbitaria sp. VM-36]